MTQMPMVISCRPAHPFRRASARANMLPVANVCMMLLPFLLLCSPGDVFRVFNIASGQQVPTPGSVQLRVSSHGLALAVGSSILASASHPHQGLGFPTTVAEALIMLVRTQPDADIVVQPDASATYADVLGVLDHLRALPTLDLQTSPMGRNRHIIVAPVSPP